MMTDGWADDDDIEEQHLPMAGMSEETSNSVLREMSRRKEAGLPEVPGDWDD